MKTANVNCPRKFSPKMECAFGLKGKDYVIVACDGHVDFSIINFKKDEDKIRVVRDIPDMLQDYIRV